MLICDYDYVHDYDCHDFHDFHDYDYHDYVK